MSDDRALLDKFVESKNVFNPDILDCVANLSNDEVFTPPKLVNEVLDTLPPEIWHDSKITFLDPACKSGVWLREVTKRLIDGLADEIPDLQNRIDHILHKQVFGIAITELTSLLSRRSLYCSKYPNGRYSISRFDDVSGNIWYQNIDHKWKNGRCVLCGANQSEYDRSEDKNSYAYGFIHIDPHYWEEVFGVKFDVIIGNPPYQLSDGGGTGSSAMPIYHKFVEAAIGLSPRYLTMIIPSRWFVGGKGLDDFRNMMINDEHISKLVDYINSKQCFPGVDIKGGVCYFLRDLYYNGPARIETHQVDEAIERSERYLKVSGVDVYIRNNTMVEILEKVKNIQDESGYMDQIISPRRPYGFSADIFGHESKYGLPKLQDKPVESGLEILGLLSNKRTYKYMPLDYPVPKREWLPFYKVFIGKAYGCGAVGEQMPTPVLATPVLATPVQLCSETFLQIGKFNSREEALNCIKYIKTKFFRLMVGIKKTTQNTSMSTYSFVPLQDFTNNSDIPWNADVHDVDRRLYKKYNLSNKEMQYIENMVEEMK